MSGAAGPVRGRQGPRKPAGNLYPVKTRCECVDGRGAPSPLTGGDGDCVKCGHYVLKER